MNVNETVDKSIFGSFQKDTMEELRDIEEDLKSICFDMPMLRALKGKLDAFEYQYKTEIANLNAQVLMQGEEIKRLNSSLSDAHKNNRARKMTENAHAVEMGKLSDELSKLRHEAAGVSKRRRYQCTRPVRNNRIPER